jgi:NAD+ kinase
MSKAPYPDIRNKKVAIIYKKSRFAYTQAKGSKTEKEHLLNVHDPMAADLKRAHENNLLCLERVIDTVEELKLPYDVILRTSLKENDITDQLVITVGGDGTVLDTSHYCERAPLLGVNSDPEQSVGALCIANQSNIRDILLQIMANTLQPSPIQRLNITLHGLTKKIKALNDVLYCHQNPAATSRYYISTRGISESHRSSGVWISTPAGSTAAIFSCGGPALPMEANEAIFQVREPYWCDPPKAQLFANRLGPADTLTIRSNMTDAHIYVDGPHKSYEVPFGESVAIGLAESPLWLYNGKLLNLARSQAIEQRRALRRLLKDK